MRGVDLMQDSFTTANLESFIPAEPPNRALRESFNVALPGTSYLDNIYSDGRHRSNPPRFCASIRAMTSSNRGASDLKLFWFCSGCENYALFNGLRAWRLMDGVSGKEGENFKLLLFTRHWPGRSHVGLGAERLDRRTVGGKK